MSRLTNRHYYDRHKCLRHAWRRFDTLYTVVPIAQQWQIHAFYQPAELLTLDELAAHRRKITKEQSTLPQTASKAFARLFRVFMVVYRQSERYNRPFDELLRRTVVKMRRSGQVHLAVVMRPAPDLQLLSHALMRLQEELVKQRHALDGSAA